MKTPSNMRVREGENGGIGADRVGNAGGAGELEHPLRQIDRDRRGRAGRGGDELRKITRAGGEVENKRAAAAARRGVTASRFQRRSIP